MRSSIRSAILRLPSSTFIPAINFYYKISKFKLEVLSEDNGAILLKDSNNSSIYCKVRDRIIMYRNGINQRLNQLLDDYCISGIEFKDHDVVIDCGANIGEFGLGLLNWNSKIKYIGFEPDKNLHACLLKNLPNSHIEKQGLWNKTGFITFYYATDTADSSIIEHSVYTEKEDIKVITLDEWTDGNNITKVKLLKIEAEGGEPEVLEGCVKTLAFTEYVTVDCGYERGINQESTAVDVCNFMFKNGFVLSNVSLKRGSFLFQNKLM